MSEPVSTPGAPDPASGEQPGSTDPGSLGGSQPTADTFAEERSQLEARARHEQSRADRAEAELVRLRSGAQAPAPSDDSPTPVPAAGLTLAELRAEMRRTAEIAAVASTLETDFPYADPALFGRADEFDSAEAFRAAVENSHKSVEQRIQPAVQSELEKLKERYAARFGPLTEDIAPPGGEGGPRIDGMPTLQELNRLSFSEYRAFADANPEYVKTLMRTA